MTIWDGFREWFRSHDCPLDYVLFTNYERQVEAHLAGVVDVAWNSPLAWIEAKRLAARGGRAARALLMRDSDQDLTSVVVRPIAIRAVADCAAGGSRGRDSAAGDAAAAAAPGRAGLSRGRRSGRTHDAARKPDHVGGERDAARRERRRRRGDARRQPPRLRARRTLPAGSTRVLARTAPFTVLDDGDGSKRAAVGRFRELCLGMQYADPAIRRLFDLEGLKEWRAGRTSGYAALERAVDRFRFLDGWLAAAAAAPR